MFGIRPDLTPLFWFPCGLRISWSVCSSETRAARGTAGQSYLWSRGDLLGIEYKPPPSPQARRPACAFAEIRRGFCKAFEVDGCAWPSEFTEEMLHDALGKAKARYARTALEDASVELQAASAVPVNDDVAPPPPEGANSIVI